MSHLLVRTVIQIALETVDAAQLAHAKQALVTASNHDWEQAMMTLRLHRLLPLVGYALNAQHLLDLIPVVYRDELKARYEQCRMSNILNFLTLDGILKTMRDRDLHPVLWKGVVLADSFYPDLGARSMDDIDFSVPADEMETVKAVFQTLGFQRQPQMATEDADYFANPMGILCDVHHRVRLFEGKEALDLVDDLKPSCLKSPTIPVLEPNAMVTHLIVHMDGHRDETGPILLWILDVAFVLKHWGEKLSIARLQQLMPNEISFISLMRTVRFLETEFQLPLPLSLASCASAYEPYTLSDVLRDRRLAIWGLPSLQGWLRLGACRLGLTSSRGRVYPEMSDLFPWMAASSAH